MSIVTMTPATSEAVTRSAPATATTPVTAGMLGLGPVLVASDGAAAAAGAFRVATLLATRLGAPVSVLGVVEPFPALTAGGPVPEPPEVEAAIMEELREQIEAQVATASPTPNQWPIDIRRGPPPFVIASRAHDLHSPVIVLGLGRHRLTDRLFGTETALQALRLADVPVLAVPPTFRMPVRRVLIAVDFSANSLRATRVALALFPDVEAIDLVHVTPPFAPAVVATPWESEFGAHVAEAWRGFLHALALPRSLSPHVRESTLKGRAGEALLARAAATAADLIVTGSHGLGFIGRMIVGSVATQVLRGAEIGVLAVPISDDQTAHTRFSVPTQ
jgi:nucleotide-binding universal stress UspA family protein